MNQYTRIPTTAEVFAVLRARHHNDMKCFSSFSDPTGTFMGGPGERGRMETAYCLEGADFPLIEARTTWDISQEKPHERMNEAHEYWLIVARNVDV